MVTRCSLPLPAMLSFDQVAPLAVISRCGCRPTARARNAPPWGGACVRAPSSRAVSIGPASSRRCDVQPRSWARAARSPAWAGERALASPCASNLKGSAGLASEARLSRASRGLTTSKSTTVPVGCGWIGAGRDTSSVARCSLELELPQLLAPGLRPTAALPPQ